MWVCQSLKLEQCKEMDLCTRTRLSEPFKDSLRISVGPPPGRLESSQFAGLISHLANLHFTSQPFSRSSAPLVSASMVRGRACILLLYRGLNDIDKASSSLSLSGNNHYS